MRRREGAERAKADVTGAEKDESHGEEERLVAGDDRNWNIPLTERRSNHLESARLDSSLVPCSNRVILPRSSPDRRSSMLVLYNLLFPFVVLALLPGYLARMFRRGNYRAHFGERFGRYEADVRARLDALPPDRIWIHAVSVGEMFLALKLIAALRVLRPELGLVLTTTTVTGRALADERVPAEVVVLYAPLDAWWIVPRAFRAIRPSQIALVEAEVWPNWLASARRGGVPVALVNARLSPRSERRFRTFRWLTAPQFRLLAWISVPEPADIARWESLGVSHEKLACLGSIKFDDAVAASDSARVDSFRELLRLTHVCATERPILLGGSTHAGEELLLARVWRALQPEFPELLLAIAPRHVERTNEIAEALHGFPMHVARRSLLDRDFTLLQRPDVLLLDTTGELRDWYALASVVFVGKSLATSATGGQNPAEPLAAGVPAICGPRMENFADLVNALLAAKGLVQVGDEAALIAAARELLHSPEKGQALAARGREVLQAHRGAAARNAQKLSGG